ncbi:MAG: YceI family protein [Hyphomonadaceae bacterium]
MASLSRSSGAGWRARVVTLAGALSASLLVSSCISTATPDPLVAGAGEYVLEKPHSSLIWRVRHMGLSNYTARFVGIDATLDFDPDDPEASKLSVVVDPMSVRTDNPDAPVWDQTIARDFFKAGAYPQIVFRSTSIERTGEASGNVTGDLSFLGETHPVTLEVTFNGAISGSPLYRGRDVIGFSAHGSFSRSTFGLTRYASFVGDDVELQIEAEFSKAR